MGQPSIVRTMLPCGGRTRGSETSQYPKEEKSKEIPKVAASEMGPGQTLCLHRGLKDHKMRLKIIVEISGKV